MNSSGGAVEQHPTEDHVAQNSAQVFQSADGGRPRNKIPDHAPRVATLNMFRAMGPTGFTTIVSGGCEYYRVGDADDEEEQHQEEENYGDGPHGQGIIDEGKGVGELRSWVSAEDQNPPHGAEALPHESWAESLALRRQEQEYYPPPPDPYGEKEERRRSKKKQKGGSDSDEDRGRKSKMDKKSNKSRNRQKKGKDDSLPSSSSSSSSSDDDKNKSINNPRYHLLPHRMLTATSIRLRQSPHHPTLIPRVPQLTSQTLRIRRATMTFDELGRKSTPQ